MSPAKIETFRQTDWEKHLAEQDMAFNKGFAPQWSSLDPAAQRDLADAYAQGRRTDLLEAFAQQGQRYVALVDCFAKAGWLLGEKNIPAAKNYVSLLGSWTAAHEKRYGAELDLEKYAQKEREENNMSPMFAVEIVQELHDLSLTRSWMNMAKPNVIEFTPVPEKTRAAFAATGLRPTGTGD